MKLTTPTTSTPFDYTCCLSSSQYKLSLALDTITIDGVINDRENYATEMI